MARDLYAEITAKIVAQLEMGTAPWHKPWTAGEASISGELPLRHNGMPYRGVNVVSLWCDAMLKGYANRYWLTFKQAQEYGGNVRKGEKSSMVVYASAFTKEQENKKTGEIEDRTIPFLKAYAVFNAEQCENLPERFTVSDPVNPTTVTDPTRNAAVDAWIAGVGATIRHGGNRAFYTPSADYIAMPQASAFDEMASYYSTLIHEHVHWSGHKSRLDRLFPASFGDDKYAAEELVAELGAAFGCGLLHISNEPRADHASYLATWIKVLKANNRAIFVAASKAQIAIDYLDGLATEKEQEEEVQEAA